MGQFNPLFVDSTRVRGEKIVASIEVTGVQLRPGESVAIRILDSESGENSSWRLDLDDSGNFVGQVWLNHQGQIFFQIQILLGERHLFSSEWRATSGSYGLFAEWQPYLGIQKVPNLRQREEAPLQRESVGGLDSVTRPLREGFHNLIALWDL